MTENGNPEYGVSDATIYAWRKRLGELEAVDVKRLRQLESENVRAFHSAASTQQRCALWTLAHERLAWDFGVEDGGSPLVRVTLSVLDYALVG